MSTPSPGSLCALDVDDVWSLQSALSLLSRKQRYAQLVGETRLSVPVEAGFIIDLLCTWFSKQSTLQGRGLSISSHQQVWFGLPNYSNRYGKSKCHILTVLVRLFTFCLKFENKWTDFGGLILFCVSLRHGRYIQAGCQVWGNRGTQVTSLKSYNHGTAFQKQMTIYFRTSFPLSFKSKVWLLVL